MNSSRTRTIIVLFVILLVTLACIWFPKESPDNAPSKADLEKTQTAVVLNQAEISATETAIMQEKEFEATALSDIQTKTADVLIFGVEPQWVTCEGEYTATFTNVDEPHQTCSYTVPFSLEFWNVGALGGYGYGEATFSWSYVDFQYADCSINQMPDKVSTGEFSGGPNGQTSIAWASIRLNSGQTGSLSYSDEDETVSGTCTIDNPSAFSGWTGP